MERAPKVEGWNGRPRAARAVQAVVFATPIVVSLACTSILVRVLPTPEFRHEVVAWWALLASMATIVLAGSDRFARRFLPLAALLKMSLVFPERAPSRLKVAMRAADAERLQQRIDELRRRGLGDTPSQAAERLLELVGMLNAHDRRTRGHSERVRCYTAMIAEELRLSKSDLNRLQWAALLHDVGKLFVPVELLDKPGRLDADEFEVVKRHPQWGADLVAPLVPWLGEWARAVPEHHERWDGGGYPRGLKGTEISYAARIVSVADAYDVMTSTRSYQEAMSTVRARRELARCSGAQFDPDVVRAFLRLSLGRQRRAVVGPLTWLAQIPLLAPFAASAGAVSPAVVASSSTAGVAAGIVMTAGSSAPGAPSADGETAMALPGTASAPVAEAATAATPTTAPGGRHGAPPLPPAAPTDPPAPAGPPAPQPGEGTVSAPAPSTSSTEAPSPTPTAAPVPSTPPTTASGGRPAGQVGGASSTTTTTGGDTSSTTGSTTTTTTSTTTSPSTTPSSTPPATSTTTTTTATTIASR